MFQDDAQHEQTLFFGIYTALELGVLHLWNNILETYHLNLMKSYQNSVHKDVVLVMLRDKASLHGLTKYRLTKGHKSRENFF